jgi:hypothetical protein
MNARLSRSVQRVRSALQGDSRTQDAAVDVVNEGGTLTLTGTVATKDIRQVAEEIAQQQEGVIQVINELRIDSGGKESEKPVVATPAPDVHQPFMGTRPEVLN